MSRFERVCFILGMGLILIGLLTLFDGVRVHSQLHPKQYNSNILNNKTNQDPPDHVLLNSSIPGRTIILFNWENDVDGESS